LFGVRLDIGKRRPHGGLELPEHLLGLTGVVCDRENKSDSEIPSHPAMLLTRLGWGLQAPVEALIPCRSESPTTSLTPDKEASMKPVMLCLLVIAVTACVSAPQRYLHADHKPLTEQQRDTVECQALVAQAATGAGAWSTDPHLRAALFNQARDEQFQQCLESRGWHWRYRLNR
jgi:hypothetical protein